MNFVLFIVLAVCAYILFRQAEKILVIWAGKRSPIVASNERVGLLAFFAVIGIISTAIQLIAWSVQGVAYVTHLFV